MKRWVLRISVVLCGLVVVGCAPNLPSSVVTRDQAVEVALAHLSISRVTKKISDAFNLRVSEYTISKDAVTSLMNPRHGTIKYKNLSNLADRFDVYRIIIQHGMRGDTTVYVTKEGGKVILVQFLSEG